MLAEFGEDAKILAGGHSLVPMLAMRLTHFEHLIDISRIGELTGIDLVDGQIVVHAATPHALVGLDDEVADSVPLLMLATHTSGTFRSARAALSAARSRTPTPPPNTPPSH